MIEKHDSSQYDSKVVSYYHKLFVICRLVVKTHKVLDLAVFRIQALAFLFTHLKKLYLHVKHVFLSGEGSGR